MWTGTIDSADPTASECHWAQLNTRISIAQDVLVSQSPKRCMLSALCPQSMRVVGTLESIRILTDAAPSAPPTATWMFSPQDLRLHGVSATSRPATRSRTLMRPPITIRASSESLNALATVSCTLKWPSLEITEVDYPTA